MNRRAVLPLALASALVAIAALADPPPTVSPAKTMAAAGMVDIRSLVPDIAEDIHYAGSDNFTGAPVPGYRAPKCFLLKPAAEALARVEHALRKQHARLEIWDCYRPARAVAAFVRWVHDSDANTKAAHYPNVDKNKLLGEYIAPVSGHSRGATVDLTMMQCDVRDRHCKPLDMGTHFDLFDPLAHTDSPQATAAQHANRERLLHAMAAQGFEKLPCGMVALHLHHAPAADRALRCSRAIAKFCFCRHSGAAAAPSRRTRNPLSFAVGDNGFPLSRE